jgi:hypothetical protein
VITAADERRVREIVGVRLVGMTAPWQNPKVVDFAERVGSTAVLAGYAVYVALPHVSTTKDFQAAGLAALGSAAKFVILKISGWQSTQLAASAAPVAAPSAVPPASPVAP